MGNDVLRSIAYFCLLYLFGISIINAKQAPIKMLSVSNDCNNNGVVNFYLTNISSNEMNVLYKSLPWAINSFSVHYIGYMVDGGDVKKLGRNYIIADYFTSVNIHPGATNTGSLNMSSVFQGFSRARASGDVIVYWEFDANRLTSPLSVWDTTEQGIILFPKTGFFSNPCGGVIYDPH